MKRNQGRVQKTNEGKRLVKQALEPKDRLVLRAGCQHAWPCSGKPAIVLHDRGKIFTSERARQQGFSQKAGRAHVG